MSICDHPEIFDLTIGSADAMVAVKSLVKDLATRVKVVEHGVCISPLGCCKSNNLKLLAEYLETLNQVWSYIDLDWSHVSISVWYKQADFPLH